MSPRAFQYHMYWFRFQIAMRKVLRSAQKELRSAAPRILAGLRWAGQVWLLPLWMFFVLSIALWERLERRTRGRYHLRTWQRGLYCVGLSLGLGLTIALLKGWDADLLSLLLFCGPGLLLFVTWKRGSRWLGMQLGVRPVRSTNSEDAYAGLDLGN